MTKDEALNKATDKEARDILEDVPLVHDFMKYIDGEGATIARICIDELGELVIFPEEGGCLSVKIEHLRGDIAPFAD